jgi:hypothetical protein
MDPKAIRLIYDKLEQLRQSDTVNSFSHALYELITDRLATAGGDTAGVILAFMEFLSVELNYHRQLSTLAMRERTLVSDLKSLGEKRIVNLEAIAESIAAGPASSRELRGLQHLILAECRYHQRKVADVIQHLRMALDCGIDHYLLQFALGYNIYAFAVEQYAVPSSDGTEVVISDSEAFLRNCLIALSVLETSFSGTDFDTEVCWWMGHIFDSAGMADAAAEMQTEVAAAMAAGDEPIPEDELDRAGESGESEPPLSRITDEEITEAGRLLRGSFSLSDLRGEEPGDE